MQSTPPTPPMPPMPSGEGWTLLQCIVANVDRFDQCENLAELVGNLLLRRQLLHGLRDAHDLTDLTALIGSDAMVEALAKLSAYEAVPIAARIAGLPGALTRRNAVAARLALARLASEAGAEPAERIEEARAPAPPAPPGALRVLGRRRAMGARRSGRVVSN